MNAKTIAGICKLTMLSALSCVCVNSGAEIFYAGDTKGLPNEFVELSVNARAGTVLEGLDIVPDYDAVASVLHLVSFTPMPAWRDGGLGACAPNDVTPTACVFFYNDPGKSFASDTLLATLRFQIDPAAVPGVVPFDPGIVVDADILPLEAPNQFEVLAVPEPSAWALYAMGLLVVIGALRRSTRARFLA